MENILFNNFSWKSIEESVLHSLHGEIDAIAGNSLLNTSIADLVAHFSEKYRRAVPTILDDQIHVEQREAQIDVSRNMARDVRDRTRPFMITGTRIELVVPFEGDASAFRVVPTVHTAPPVADLKNNTVLISIVGTDLDRDQVKNTLDQTLGNVRRHLEWLTADTEALNRRLSDVARTRIEARRQKLLQDQNLASSLGFQLRERPDAIKTFIAPQVQRRIVPVMPTAVSSPYKPEPTLGHTDYDHILGVISQMALVMERSPSAFESMDEEALRFHFLVQLNAQYNGDATGETFNFGGKTDILIRVGGKNIFIGECKYWRGAKQLGETIDQIRGYATWRDTKLAIVLFNKNKNFSNVVESIPEIVRAHKSFKRELTRPSETSFRFVISHRDDPNREMTLTVMAFDVPRKDAA